MKRNSALIQLLIIHSSLLIFASCSVQKQISRSAQQIVLKDSSLATAHVGISIYEPATGKHWFNYQGDYYFVPASNTKIPTCYAAMKYLGDSLVGLRYTISETGLIIQPSGDPSFLHPDFKIQPVYDFLKSQNQNIFYAPSNAVTGWGSGWAWNDYAENYMAERSAMPIYGNLVRFRKMGEKNIQVDSTPSFSINIIPGYFRDKKIISKINWANAKGFSIDRLIAQNLFIITPANNSGNSEVPFTNIPEEILPLLTDTLHKAFLPMGTIKNKLAKIIHSQPTDSLLKPMMHRSDNFFAEQSLLMVSNELLSVMNDEKIIDTLLKTDFKDLPQKPRWVDGSGLSRYNLFSPQDLVFILNKMKIEFGMGRVKTIFATGNEGTLEGRYKTEVGYIFAKTGTLSGVVALSGFLYTKKNKLLIFSILVNNHNNNPSAVRTAIEKFIRSIREKY